MKILIFGAGALGQGIGGFLAAAGNDVTLLLREKYARAISEGGLDVTGILGERRVPPGEIHLATNADELTGENFDFILLSVKSYDTAASIPLIARIASDETIITSIQNGYGNVEALEQAFGPERVLCARVITGFRVPKPGSVDITVHADDVTVGSFSSKRHPAALQLADALCAAGIPARTSENVEADLWGKIVYNIALNPLGAILGVHYGALGHSEYSRAVMDRMIDEAFAVMARLDFPCRWATADEFREIFYSKQIPATYDHRSSMLQDITAGKRTEIDCLNGAVVRLGREAGVATPVNSAITNQIRFLESHGA